MEEGEAAGGGDDEKKATTENESFSRLNLFQD